MTELVFLLIFIGLVVCFFDARLGMYVTLVSGFLQDPLRKILPDEPVYLTGLVVVFAAATFVGGKVRGVIPGFRAVEGWRANLGLPVEVFILLVALQSAATLVYTGSLILAGIGLLVYLAPLPGLLMAHGFASDFKRVETFLWAYVGLSAAMVSGVYLSSFGFEWDLLRTVGEPLIVYSEEKGAIFLPAGFFRAPEIAAWHAASGACIALILGLSRRRPGAPWISGLLALFFAGAVLLSGRRKFLLEIIVFLPVFWFLLRHFRIGNPRFIRTMLAVTVMGAGLAVFGIATDDTVENIRDASQRAALLQEQVWERMVNLTVGSFTYVIEQNGVFGSGAGTGSQGAQHFGGGSEIVGLAAEGGLGKVLAELGVPGLMIFFWIGIMFSRYIWQTLGGLVKGDPQVARVAMGLAAFLVANGIVFLGAHQIFGDLFVLLLLGTFLGFIIATRRLRFASKLAPTEAGVREQARSHGGMVGVREQARSHPPTLPKAIL